MDITPVIPVLLIVLAVALLEVLLFSVPLRIRMRLEHRDNAGKANLSLFWLCLGIRANISGGSRHMDVLLGKRPLFSAKYPEITGTPVIPRGTGPGTIENEEYELPALLKSAIRHTPRIISLFRSAARSISLENIDCHVTMGLLSPAQTGIVYGYSWAFKSMFRCTDRVHIVVIPDFNRERLDGYLEGVLRVRHPFALIVRLWHVYTLLHAFPETYASGRGGRA